MIPSLIRTYVPLAVAWLAGVLLAAGLEVSTSAQLALSTLIGGLLALGYYLVVRELTTRWPGAGWLLGYPTAPTYDGPTVSDLLPAVIRTAVPLVVATVASWLLSLGVTLDADTQVAIVTGLGGLIAAAYYAAARWLERRLPRLGVFLGVAKTPTYLPAA